MTDKEYRKAARMIGRILVNMGMPSTEIEDLVQETLTYRLETNYKQSVRSSVIDIVRLKCGRAGHKMDGLLVMESYADDALAQPYNSNLVDLEYALERLHPRRKKVISLFLKGNKFREIGEKLGVTSERAHQIYKVAIEEAKIILERKRR